jgi:septum formation protein
MTKDEGDIILASASQSRRKLLEAAGIAFRTVPADVDEATMKRHHVPLSTGFDHLATQLATEKALVVAARNPGALVIGADQVLVCEGAVFDKPENLAAARQQLLRLRGRTHELETAVACARDEDVLWSHVEAPRLTMRAFSPDHLEAYVAAEGNALMESVGGYKLEGPGIQLFERVTGDYFAILGLPLLPLLAFLRDHGAITK